MNQLQVFNHSIFGELPILVVNNTECFGAVEAARSLSFGNPYDAIKNHVDEDDLAVHEVIDRLGRKQQKKFINESGLYSLIFGAAKQGNNPEIKERAKKFKRWVTSEVLPSIRKTGSYSVGIDETQLSPELQIMSRMVKSLARAELEQKRLENEIKQTNERLDNVSNIVALNPKDWRQEVNKIINSIAFKHSKDKSYRDIRNESYQLLEARAKCDLERRLQNKRKTMALEGVSKSQIDKANKMDVIESDKRLTEIYLAIIKEMAIKYQISLEGRAI